MPETTPLIKAALNLRVGAGFDVYVNATPSTVLLSTTDIMPPNLPPFETIFESKLPLF